MFPSFKRLASPRARRPLRVEALEDRQLLTATAQVVGTTLTITSSNPAAALNESVKIFDGGRASGANNFMLELDGKLQMIDSEIRTVTVNLGRGNDSVYFRMLGELVPGSSRAVTIDLGDGNDVFLMDLNTLHGPLAGKAGATFDLKVLAGAGADTVRLQANPSITDVGGSFVARPWTLAAGSRFAATLVGGPGNDAMRFDQTPAPILTGGLDPIHVEAATLAVAMNGGEGHDFLTNGLVAKVTAGGAYGVAMAGAAGNDVLRATPITLLRNTVARYAGSTTLRLDGGIGSDLLRASVNADVMPGGAYSAVMLGGADADAAELDYRGRLDGVLSLNMDGGLGNDVMTAVLSIDRLSAGKVGDAAAPATVRGGAGDDIVTFQAAHVFTQVMFAARLLGDAGADVGVHSPTSVQAGGDLETLFEQDLES